MPNSNAPDGCDGLSKTLVLILMQNRPNARYRDCEKRSGWDSTKSSTRYSG